MNLFLDGRPAFGGIHRVVQGLVAGLRARCEPGDVEVYGDRGEDPVTPDHRLTPLRRVLRPWIGSARRVVTEQICLGRAARRASTDLIHSPHGVVPFHSPRPWIVSLWDLSPINSEFACGPPLMRRYRSWCFQRAVVHADHVVVPSDAVRRDLIGRFGLPEDRVTRIYPLFGPWFGAPVARLPEPRHLLHVGTIEPRKNLERLLDAYEVLDPATRPPLLLAGRYGWRQRSLVERVCRMGPTVRWLGEIDDDELGRLYRTTAVLIQPSRHEGFDLPVAEGLSVGVPVVASDIPIHREVAGGCAFFAPADDARLLAAAILKALGLDRDQRCAWSVAARARVAGLASSDPVAEHMEVYRRVVGRRKHP